MSDSEEGCHQITLKIKTTTETYEVKANENSSIRELKEIILPKVPNAAIEQLCLIFSGKILKDHESLSELGLQDGLTLHLVVRTKPKSDSSATSSSTQPASATTTSVSAPAAAPSATASDPFGVPGLGMNPFGLGGLGGMNLGQMQQQLLSNPDAMRQMMDSPIMQGLLNNPDVLRSMILNNPEIQNLIERNPEVGHMLNNPDLLRQTMEMVRNPAALQELMRSHDRAVSNLEAIPGGMAALQRMYRDVQEPMMDAAQQQITGQNPFTALLEGSQQPSAQSARAGTENREPLPNPWAPRTPSSAATPSSTRPGGTVGAAQPSQANAGLGAFGNLASIINSPGYQSLLSQVAGNPELMQNVLAGPHMQQVMQNMAQNPALMDTVMASDPLLSSNPQLQEQFRRNFPQMLQQMQRPEVSAALANPRVMRAIQQVQEGMQILQQEAPFLLQGMNMGAGSLLPTLQPTATSDSTGASASPTGAGTAGHQAANLQQLAGLNDLMRQLLVQPGANQQPPEERYRSQLETLAGMGFVNRDANIQALVACFGNIEAAIERLLNQPRNGGGNFS